MNGKMGGSINVTGNIDVKGERGEQGEQGIQGIQGLKGNGINGKNKFGILNYISFGIVIITFIFIITSFVMMVYPYKTINLYDFKVVSTEERPMNLGTLIIVSWTFDKYRPIPASYSFGLIPEMKGGMNMCYQLESGTVNSPIGTHKSIKAIKASEEVAAGNYKVRLTLTYQINVLRDIVRVFDTENLVQIKDGNKAVMIK